MTLFDAFVIASILVAIVVVVSTVVFFIGIMKNKTLQLLATAILLIIGLTLLIYIAYK